MLVGWGAWVGFQGAGGILHNAPPCKRFMVHTGVLTAPEVLSYLLTSQGCYSGKC